MERRKNTIFLFFLTMAIISFINCAFEKNNNRNETLINSESLRRNHQSNMEQCKNSNIITSPFSTSQCDIMTNGPICIAGLNRVLLPSAVPKGLIGYWNFDESQPIDNSGSNNHAIGKSLAGAAFGGEGASALFSGGDYLEVPFNKAFVSNEFTISFWLYLVQDSYSFKSRFCPFLQRGDDDLSSKVFKRAPALYYDRKEKTLRLFVKTTKIDSQQGESVTSNSSISAQKWLHIGVVKIGMNLRIYVNGILDNEVTTTQNLENNESPLYIGNVPWLKDQCDFPFLIDELRYYNIAISEDHLQAEASPALGGIEPNFIQLGCMDCSLKDASKACVEGYHLCTSIELHTGGYQVARSMGWLKWNTHIWSHGALKNAKKFKKLKGISLCCADLK